MCTGLLVSVLSLDHCEWVIGALVYSHIKSFRSWGGLLFARLFDGVKGTSVTIIMSWDFKRVEVVLASASPK